MRGPGHSPTDRDVPTPEKRERTALRPHGGHPDVSMSDLNADELQPVGGSWNGMLFENPISGYPLALSWTFTIEFAEVDRDYGSVSPSLSIDWVPSVASSWNEMAGQSFSGRSFAAPIETSLYFFEHYRFDHVDLAIESQTLDELTVHAAASGDIDGLGLAEVSTRAALSFAGIYVQTKATGVDRDAATALLARFVDIDGLQPSSRGHNVIFERLS